VGDQVELGLGKKLKEVNIQTHQWIRRKSKSADREYIGKYILDIFDREPTYQKFIFGRNSSVYGVQRIEVLGLN